MIIPELVTSLQKNSRLRKSEAWCVCLLILRLRPKLTPANYFQATPRKPNMSMFWLASAVVLLSALRMLKVLWRDSLMGMILVMLSVLLLVGISN